jgi:hypothetical protein
MTCSVKRVAKVVVLKVDQLSPRISLNVRRNTSSRNSRVCGVISSTDFIGCPMTKEVSH